MTEPQIDFEAVFQALPAGLAVLNQRLEYVAVNESYTQMAGRRPEELVGHYIFGLFPDNPFDPDSEGSRTVGDSFLRVLATGVRDTLPLQRFDVERGARTGVFEERYWSIINSPMPGPSGRVEYVIHRVEEVTDYIRTSGVSGQRGRSAQELQAEVYMRARELQDINDALRSAHAREREIALTLQDAMLPAPQPVGHRAAVRYQPAVGALNVCGDWYDLVDLPRDRMAVAVGDVVGHGLEAAGVMGQLRSALSAASRATAGPGEALEILGLYSRSIEGAEATTAVSVFIDWPAHTIKYSSAGHPPPALVDQAGHVRFLDLATDPPLGARPDHVPRPQATARFTPDSALVLYTDGLIERRHEDIDLGLARLSSSLTRHHSLDPESLADVLLSELLPPTGATDDTALVVIRL
ncbi:PP2C family protein-serine/threonine phosphatase [Actinacidiphila acididurans]|uniref:SpoIIE family protein phosphatase n=1 Tax=Actinacidiphila acididurans TaxID=2784346 RepID=A0ABS2U4M1_9ACTN|nr:SpoIIE family protein phosphatase [Actinacidiphila acididurans]MBM9510572.1 SpoIIE family protein phosphatase [Actinacidiphila acididurans]